MFPGLGSARDKEVRDLFDTHYESLCRLAFVMLREAGSAEEIVMDAFVKTFTGWARIGSMDRPDLYLRKAVVNACTSRLRRLSAEARANRRLGALPVAALMPLDTDLWDAVRALPRRQRACVVLRYLEDRSESEVALILDCSTGTVKSQLAKARQKLKMSLSPARTSER